MHNDSLTKIFQFQFIPNRNDNFCRDVIVLSTKKWPRPDAQGKSCDIIVQMAYLAREWNFMTDASSPILVVSK